MLYVKNNIASILSWTLRHVMLRIVWTPQETQPGRCNKKMLNGLILPHLGMYINHWILLLKNTTSLSISKI